uniref:probable NAD(P)H dehydrogenase (quinone) FQR1-like 1 n=1 Tax=Erigeron canadensis TaxID=72917 RepID=UPI001CB8DB24|nr:probable NAD(P)H dehydrogenase (quinone) FQR1-like 1 [Erigeron canadensis]
MGKGGGCFPSKNKPPEPDQNPENPNPNSDPVPVVTNTHNTPYPSITTTTLNPETKKLKIFIVFYSMYGHVESLARNIKKGVDEIDGVEGVLFRVPETLSQETLLAMKVPMKSDDDIKEILDAEELLEADGLLFGFPTRYGTMSAQMKAFFDTTGGLWKEQKLAGIPAGFFVSTGTQGGGQETTAWTAITQLAHHGMIYVPIGYTFGAGMFKMDSIRGGSPYGAGVYSGDGTREPSQTELELALHQGKYMAMIVKRFGPAQ